MIKATCVATMCLLSPLNWALGLGEAQLNSVIGEPLLAKIPIIQANENFDLNDIIVRQIRGQSAQELGYQLAADAPPYTLKLEEVDGGNLIVVARTQKALNDPFISILLEMEWPKGSLQREYNLLLDLAPLQVNAATASGAIKSGKASAGVVPKSNANSPARSSAPAPSAPTITGSTVTGSRSALTPAESFWTVGNGDTLSQIAQKIRPDENIKLTAVVDALQRLNPQAFERGDINQLQLGYQLALPSARDYMAMPLWNPSQPLQLNRSVSQVAGDASEATQQRFRQKQNQAQPSAANSAQGNTSQTNSPIQDAANSYAQMPKKSGQQAFNSSSTPTRKEAGEAYQVKSGDTLSQVAQQLRQDPQVNLQDMMEALYRANPGAFNNGDINQLRQGAQLYVPAHGHYQPQSTDLAGSNGSSSPLPSDKVGESSVTQTTNTGNTNNPAPQNTGVAGLDSDQVLLDSQPSMPSEGHLSLSQPRDNLVDSANNNSPEAIRRQIDAVSELVDKIDRENAAIRERITRIEQSDQVALLEQLLELQNRQIQNLRDTVLNQQSAAPTATDTDLDPITAVESDTTANLGEDNDAPINISNLQGSLLQEQVTQQINQPINQQQSQPNSLPAPAGDLPTDNTAPDEAATYDTSITVDSSDSTINDVGKKKPETTVVIQDNHVSTGFRIFTIALLTIIAALIGGLLYTQRQRLKAMWMQKPAQDKANPVDLSPQKPDANVVVEEINSTEMNSAKTNNADNNSEGDIDKSGDIAATASALGQTQNEPLEDSAEVSDSERSATKARDHQAPKSEDDILKQESSLTSKVLDDLISQDQSRHLDHLSLPTDSDFDKDTEADDGKADFMTSDEFLPELLEDDFDFSLPDDVLSDMEEELDTSNMSQEEILKASIRKKVSKYSRTELQDVLDQWNPNSLPTAELDEHNDLITEAMIYAAYGRFQHAEKMIQTQLEENPDEPSLQEALDRIHQKAREAGQPLPKQP